MEEIEHPLHTGRLWGASHNPVEDIGWRSTRAEGQGGDKHPNAGSQDWVLVFK